MKVAAAVRWFLRPEQVKELETEFESFTEYIQYKVLDHLAKEVAEMDMIINYLAWLMFDPKDEDEGAEK